MQPRNTRILVRTHAVQSESKEDEGINRYRKDWDANAKADGPDSAAGTPGSVASTRTTGNADWYSSAASQTGNITIDYIHNPQTA